MRCSKKAAATHHILTSLIENHLPIIFYEFFKFYLTALALLGTLLLAKSFSVLIKKK